jgi:hypothetical protein
MTTPLDANTAATAPVVDDANRFALHAASAVKIHATAKLLGTDADTAANGGAQLYHFIASLVVDGWILCGIDPADGQTRPIEWSGFAHIKPSGKEQTSS